MKEIKAYVLKSRLKALLNALERAGAPGVTMVDVRPVGYGYEPDYFQFDFSDILKRYKHLQIVKVELVCADEDAGMFVRVIRSECETGAPDDGMIFISHVNEAIRLGTGSRGEEALKAA